MPEQTDHAEVADIQDPLPFGLDSLADDRGSEILAYQVRIILQKEVGARFLDPSSGFAEVLASTGEHVSPQPKTDEAVTQRRRQWGTRVCGLDGVLVVIGSDT
jgi:hypothetical protein